MRAPALISAALLSLAACSSATGEADGGASGDEDVKAPAASEAKAILQDWFDDNPQCTPFFAMPHDVPVESDYSRKQARAFVEAGLLREEGELSLADPNSGSGQRRVVRYAPTAEGEKQFRPGSGALDGIKTMICYGHRRVGTVEVGDPDTLGGRVSITYRYRLDDVPAWARSPSVLGFYPTFREWLDREEEDHETLVLKDGQWALERAPSSGMFDFRQLAH